MEAETEYSGNQWEPNKVVRPNCHVDVCNNVAEQLIETSNDWVSHSTVLSMSADTPNEQGQRRDRTFLPSLLQETIPNRTLSPTLPEVPIRRVSTT